MSEPDNIQIASIGKNRGSEVRIALTVYAGQRLVDLRTYLAVDDTQVLRPTKKGCALSIARVRELRVALAKADAAAVAMGWLEPEVCA